MHGNEHEWMDAALMVKDAILAIPGPFWVAATVVLLGLGRIIHHRLKVARGGPDNKTGLYHEILAMLKDPAKWTRSGFSLASGRITLVIPNKTSKKDYTQRVINPSGVVQVTVILPDGSKHEASTLLASFFGCRLRKITKKGIVLYYGLVERETQAAAGKCLLSVRDVPGSVWNNGQGSFHPGNTAHQNG